MEIERLKSDSIKNNELIEVQNKFKSGYLRKSHFKNKLGFIEPVCIRLGYNHDNNLSFFSLCSNFQFIDGFYK